MQESIYIFTNGELKRKDNTLVFISNEGKKSFIPVENIKEIFVFGETTINKKALEFLSQKEILLSYFNHYGYYMGTFYPREHYNSGYMILKQATAYENKQKRLYLAQKFVLGAYENSKKNLQYYNKKGINLEEDIEKIDSLASNIEKQTEIDALMGIEGNIKEIYYNAFNKIVTNEEFKFTNRSKRPPKDYLNGLISFVNSLIYNYILAEIYHTHLDPRIGFLHTTNNRRFSLNLDVAEIFKPAIGDRVIFSLINKKMINSKDFEKYLNGYVLNTKGKKTVLETFQNKLYQTIKHPKIKKEVSYRRIIRLELYKIEKYLIEEEDYQPFILAW